MTPSSASHVLQRLGDVRGWQEDFYPGQVATRSGPTLAAADSNWITVHGRGAHGSMPQASIDPVVLAAMIVVRLQTVISREVQPGEPAVLTVGSVQAGTRSNVLPDHATILLNIRTYSEGTRSSILDAIKRIVTAECTASRSPRPPEFELFDQFPLTDNNPAVTERVAAAFAGYFSDGAQRLPLQTASEDFSDIPRASASPTPTGASAEPTPPSTSRPKLPDASPKTSRSTAPPILLRC